MPDWQLIADNPPHSRELLLWLRAPDGAHRPIGCVVGIYTKSDFFTGWTEKTVSGNVNTGLQQNLVTHWKALDVGPEETL